MRLTKTTLKELTKKYRAVLIKCATLNAITCGLLYSGNAMAVEDIVIDGVNINSYSNNAYEGINDIGGNIGSAVNSIKTKVDADLTSDTFGIKMDSNQINVTLMPGGIDIEAKGQTTAIYLANDNNKDDIIWGLGNIKSIVKEGGTADAYGIRAMGSDIKDIMFLDDKSIEVKTGASSASAYGILASGSDSDFNLTINNLKSIIAEAPNGSAYGIKGDNKGKLNIKFKGDGGNAISATGSNAAYSIYVSGSSETSIELTNSILSGKIHQEGDESKLSIDLYDGGVWDLKNDDVDGKVSVKVNANGIWKTTGTTLSGTFSTALRGGVWQVLSGSSGSTEATINAEDVDIEMRVGTIDLSNNGTMDTLKIGSLDIAYNSYLKIDVNLENKTIDTLSVDSVVSGSGKLNISGLTLIGSAIEEETTIAFADENLRGFVTVNDSYTLDGINYNVTYDPATGKLTFVKGKPGPDPVPPKGMFSVIKNAVQSTNEAVKASVRVRLAQLTKGSTPTSSASSKKGQSGGDEDETYGLWAQAIYSHVNRDKTGSSAGFKGHSEGVVLGADAEITDNVIAGVAYAYTNSNMKSNGAKSDIDTHGFYAYGQYKPSDWFINGSVGFGLSKADPKGSDKDIKSKFYSIDALAGYEMNYDFGNLTPAGGLRYVRIEQDSYREDGSRIEAKDADTLTAVVQLGWSNAYQVSGKEITPRASVGFIYDVKSENNKVTVTSAGAKFLTEDGRLKRFGTEISVGADAKLTNNWNLSLDYTGEFRQRYENHTGTVSVRYDF